MTVIDTSDDGPGVRGTPYATIPEWILDSGVSDRAIRLFGVLSRYVGANDNAWPSRRTLAERCGGTSVQSVDRALKELVDLGALKIEQRRRGDGSLTSSLYWLWPKTPERTYPPERGDLPSPVGLPLPSPVVQQERTTVRKNLNEEIPCSTSQAKPSAKVVYEKDFAEFWSTYPRRVDKQRALRCYATLRRRKVTHDEIMAATRAFAKSREHEDAKFTMHASRFLGPDEPWREWSALDTRPAHVPPPAEEFIAQRQRDHEVSQPMPDTLKKWRRSMLGNLA